MASDERTALRQKMHNAKTPEERQGLAEANRAAMQERAIDTGTPLSEPRGPRNGFGPGSRHGTTDSRH